MKPAKLVDVNGVGPDTAKRLAARGIASVPALAEATVERIAQVPGFGPKRAAEVRTAASALLIERGARNGPAKPASRRRAAKRPPATKQPGSVPKKPRPPAPVEKAPVVERAAAAAPPTAGGPKAGASAEKDRGAGKPKKARTKPVDEAKRESKEESRGKKKKGKKKGETDSE